GADAQRVEVLHVELVTAGPAAHVVLGQAAGGVGVPTGDVALRRVERGGDLSVAIAARRRLVPCQARAGDHAGQLSELLVRAQRAHPADGALPRRPHATRAQLRLAALAQLAGRAPLPHQDVELAERDRRE